MMTKLWALGLAVSSLLLAAGCEQGAVEESVTQDPLDDAPEEPGTCRKLCCTSADCSGGRFCQPFNPAWGSLGTCLEGAAPSTQTTATGCWTFNQPECDLGNQDCDASAGEACDILLGDEVTDPIIMCFLGENVGNEGQACDNAYGPQCAPGYHCLAEEDDDEE